MPSGVMTITGFPLIARRKNMDFLSARVIATSIKNSVNMPTLMLERSGIARICIIHRNLPGMLTKIMPVFSKDGINIENMTNKSRGAYAYSVFDVNSIVDEQAVQELKDIEGVIRVRVLR